MKFLDTNVVIRYLTGDDPVKARASLALLKSVERGDEIVRITQTHVAEICYVLSSKRGAYQLGHQDIQARLLPILRLPGVKLHEKRATIRALDIYAASPRLDIEDAIAIATMEADGLTEIVSYDSDFDAFLGIVREEPAII